MERLDTIWDFDIDRYLNRFIPKNRLNLLPKPISWFLGYRESPRPPVGNILEWFWASTGAFLGLLVVSAVLQSPGLKSRGSPSIIASFGAAAILEYHTINSPLAQPRPAILGTLLSTTLSIALTKLFLLSLQFHAPGSFIPVLAGALAVALSSALMGFTKTVHPPAGATALLCATDPAIVALGWFALPLMMLGTVLMLLVALLVNNMQRTWPLYWWSPSPDHSATSSLDLEKACSGVVEISEGKVKIPGWLKLEEEERALLENLRVRLRRRSSEVTFVEGQI